MSEGFDVRLSGEVQLQYCGGLCCQTTPLPVNTPCIDSQGSQRFCVPAAPTKHFDCERPKAGCEQVAVFRQLPLVLLMSGCLARVDCVNILIVHCDHILWHAFQEFVDERCQLGPVLQVVVGHVLVGLWLLLKAMRRKLVAGGSRTLPHQIRRKAVGDNDA